MNAFSRIGSMISALAQRASPENPSTNLSNPDEWLVEWMTGGGATAAGISVSSSSALRFSAYFACLRVIAESVASLPLIVYRRLPGGGKERATDHPLYTLLHDEPNPLMSSYVFFETAQAHVTGRGNAYAFITRGGDGYPKAIWPIPPDEIEPKIDESGRLFYESSRRDLSRVNPIDVLHVPGLGFDGIKGYNPIAIMRESLGLGIAAERMGAKFFARGSRPGGILSTDDHLDENEEARLKRAWEAAQASMENVGRTAVLHGGLKYQAISINPKDAQFMETRRFQIAEVARMFRVPLHMIQELERATFSNIEHQSLEFLTMTLRPWLIRWEMEITRKLFTAAERKVYFVEFLADAFLRSDIKTRYNAYSIAIQNGFMSRNEVRERENLNPVDGLDEMLEPLNMQNPGDGDDDDDDEEKKRLIETLANGDEK